MIVSVRSCARPSRGSRPPVRSSSTRMASRYIGVSGTRTRWWRGPEDTKEYGGSSPPVTEPVGFGHEAFDQREDSVRAVDKTVQNGAPVRGALRPILVEPGLCP